jgi:soluble lytic murein transglycosylase-like protein
VALPRFPRESEFDGTIAVAAARHSVPFPLLKAIVAVESGFNPSATRREPTGVTSYGLAQVTPAAAWGAGASAHAGADLLDPATNLDRAAAHLGALLARLGDEKRAASAYNGGERPAIGFGTRLTRDMTLCLAWKANARPAGVRTIEADCASPHQARAGEFGNQPYVDKVMAYRAAYAVPLTLSADHVGRIATAALGVAVVLLVTRRA